jgi:hypothetical protein
VLFGHPHWFSAVERALVMISLEVPRAAPQYLPLDAFPATLSGWTP